MNNLIKTRLPRKYLLIFFPLLCGVLMGGAGVSMINSAEAIDLTTASNAVTEAPKEEQKPQETQFPQNVNRPDATTEKLHTAINGEAPLNISNTRPKEP